MNGPEAPERLSLDAHGAEKLAGAATAILKDLSATLTGLAPDKAGIRIHGIAALRPILASNGPVGSIASRVLGPKSQPVRAILFDKVADLNWSLAWHQDRTICVKARHEVEGFGPWTIKQGMQHVTPPFSLLERMVTLRVHLDRVPMDNAPLLIAPGSHRYGRIREGDIERVAAQCGQHACLAEPGDVWLYATPILHASRASEKPAKRRVLQIDYSAEALPPPLEWLGV